MKEPNTLRERLLARCHQVIDAQIEAAAEAIRIVQASANEETKSSAGDKYETGRAMAQLEIEKGNSRLAEARKLKVALHQIPDAVQATVVQRGSLVATDQGNYFLAVPVGALSIDGEDWFVISPASPLGAALLGARQGQSISFLKKNMVVLRVE